jgi:hypothetical protein
LAKKAEEALKKAAPPTKEDAEKEKKEAAEGINYYIEQGKIQNIKHEERKATAQDLYDKITSTSDVTSAKEEEEKAAAAKKALELTKALSEDESKKAADAADL